MPAIPTVRVKNGDGFMVINEDDFDASIHQPYDGKPEPASGLAPDDLVIPADWEDSHWKTRVALAKKISGDDVPDADTAGVIILEEIERRAGANDG